jgi:hypothetical protein
MSSYSFGETRVVTYGFEPIRDTPIQVYIEKCLMNIPGLGVCLDENT